MTRERHHIAPSTNARQLPSHRCTGRAPGGRLRIYWPTVNPKWMFLVSGTAYGDQSFALSKNVEKANQKDT
jgi:hypothetical protein